METESVSKTESASKLQSYQMSRSVTWFLIALPKALMFGVILVIPFLMAVWISFHQWNPIAAQHPFVGLDNYARMLDDQVLHNSLINTIGYAFGKIAVGIPIALGLALMLDKRLRGTRLYTTAIFMPVVTSWAVVSLIWKFIYQPDFGLLNTALSSVGMPTYEWLRSTDTALLSILIMSLWKEIGFNMVIFLAGLSSIPETYYEAAEVDGANALQRFRHITFPLLMPTTFFVVIITLTTSFRLFTQVFVMTAGGPIHSSYSLVFFFYQQGFQQLNMGYASAVAVLLFVIVFVFSVVQEMTWADEVEYGN